MGVLLVFDVFGRFPLFVSPVFMGGDGRYVVLPRLMTKRNALVFVLVVVVVVVVAVAADVVWKKTKRQWSIWAPRGLLFPSFLYPKDTAWAK